MWISPTPNVSRRSGPTTGTPTTWNASSPTTPTTWSSLEQLPDLHFSVEDVRASVDTVVINYRNERGQAVAEVLTFRGDLVCRGFGAYGRTPAGD